MRTSTGFWKQPLANYLERVEVLKGPSSALFGNASPGGVINRVTKKPLDQAANSVSFSTGSFNTLRALEEGLENFAGCAVVISHDRWFLDRICTHILAFEGDSQVYFFEGSFSDYEENKKKRLGGDLTPKRLKYRKLIRN